MPTLQGIINRIFPARIAKALKVLQNPEFYPGVTFISYNQDRLLTQHNCDFIEDERFKKAYKIGENTDSWGNAKIHWRVHTALWAAETVKHLDGDFVECGVNKGGLSSAVIEYIDFQSIKNKKFYLLDTFEGLSEKHISEQEKQLGFRSGTYDECYEEVKQTFGKFENVVIIRGIVPDTLPEVRSEKICYLSIDMNCAEPEIAAAEFFWDKLVSGAVMLLDDYGWTEHITQKQAFDDFAKRKNVSILSLPTGQGLILKP